MRCPVFPFPRPAGRTLAAVVSLLLCALLWTLPAGAAGTRDVPMRIVSLSPLLTENVFLLGAGELARINGPAGLDIGAANPAEIALSVAAQMVATWRARV